MKKIMRGISKEFIEKFKNSELAEFYNKNRKELFLAIRNEYMNLYFNCASLCKIEYHSRLQEKIVCKIHGKYLGKEVVKGKGYECIGQRKLIDEYESIKNNIKNAYSAETHEEKVAQQEIIYKNNKNFYNGNSKWLCIDAEYVKQRNNKQENSYGRFDIIAISNDTPHKVALIELKYKTGALGGTSGMLGHTEKYIEFVNDNIYETHLKKEIINIVNNLYELGECNFTIDDESELVNQPEFYFIALNNKDDKLKKTMRKYWYESEYRKKDGTITVEKKLGKKLEKLKQKNEKLVPKFLFSDDTVGNINVGDIINGTYESNSLELRK